MTKVSITSIANKLGVSKAAVSLVLNGKQKEGRIGDVMAKKILDTAKELNYRPNELARSLRSGYSKTIGLIVADISNQFFSRLAYFVQEQANKKGYSVIFANVSEQENQMIPMIDVLRNKKVDGIIMVPTINIESNIKLLIEAKYPLVLVDRYISDIQTYNVVIDNYKASAEATQYLIDNGCKKIAIFTHKHNQPHVFERRRGYTETLDRNNLAHDQMIVEIDYNSVDEEIRRVLQSFQQENIKVDGFFFTSSSISMSGLKSLIQLGFDIKNEVKVVCFDYNDAYEFLDFKIPYILQPIQDMGRSAVDMLIDQIENQNFSYTNCILPTELIK